MKAPRLSLIIAAIMLSGLFFFPIWRITLEAPQYMEGINLYIWINKITGDIQNINILNHYVGMQYIEPDSIPELKYFPYIVIAMLILGIACSFTQKKWIYFSWPTVLLLLGLLGIYDFWLWEYDYGHNLSDKAPIKVPGMSYQPPLIGTKTLLNFKAHSWPHIGSLFLGLSIFFGYVSFYLKRKN